MAQVIKVLPLNIKKHTIPLPIPSVSRWRQPWPLQRLMPNWSVPWGYPLFHQEHNFNPKRHNLMEGVNNCMISRPVAQTKFREYQETLSSHDEVFTDGSKMNERVGAAAVINRHFQNCETTCRHLTKRLPDNSTIFAAEATAITLALNYYQHMGPVHHDVIVYSDSMSCLDTIEGEDTENPFICHIMKLLLVVE